MDEHNKEKIMLDKLPNKTAIALLDKEEINDSTIQEYTNSDIQEMIHVIRGQQVMLDSDLAKLFGYEVKKNESTSKKEYR